MKHRLLLDAIVVYLTLHLEARHALEFSGKGRAAGTAYAGGGGTVSGTGRFSRLKRSGLEVNVSREVDDGATGADGGRVKKEKLEGALDADEIPVVDVNVEGSVYELKKGDHETGDEIETMNNELEGYSIDKDNDTVPDMEDIKTLADIFAGRRIINKLEFSVSISEKSGNEPSNAVMKQKKGEAEGGLALRDPRNGTAETDQRLLRSRRQTSSADSDSEVNGQPIAGQTQHSLEAKRSADNEEDDAVTGQNDMLRKEAKETRNLASVLSNIILDDSKKAVLEGDVITVLQEKGPQFAEIPDDENDEGEWPPKTRAAQGIDMVVDQVLSAAENDDEYADNNEEGDEGEHRRKREAGDERKEERAALRVARSSSSSKTEAPTRSEQTAKKGKTKVNLQISPTDDVGSDKQEQIIDIKTDDKEGLQGSDLPAIDIDTSDPDDDAEERAKNSVIRIDTNLDKKGGPRLKEEIIKVTTPKHDKSGKKLTNQVIQVQGPGDGGGDAAGGDGKQHIIFKTNSVGERDSGDKVEQLKHVFIPSRKKGKRKHKGEDGRGVEILEIHHPTKIGKKQDKQGERKERKKDERVSKDTAVEEKANNRKKKEAASVLEIKETSEDEDYADDEDEDEDDDDDDDYSDDDGDDFDDGVKKKQYYVRTKEVDSDLGGVEDISIRESSEQDGKANPQTFTEGEEIEVIEDDSDYGGQRKRSLSKEERIALRKEKISERQKQRLERKKVKEQRRKERQEKREERKMELALLREQKRKEKLQQKFIEKKIRQEQRLLEKESKKEEREQVREQKRQERERKRKERLKERERIRQEKEEKKQRKREERERKREERKLRREHRRKQRERRRKEREEEREIRHQEKMEKLRRLREGGRTKEKIETQVETRSSNDGGANEEVSTSQITESREANDGETGDEHDKKVKKYSTQRQGGRSRKVTRETGVTNQKNRRRTSRDAGPSRTNVNVKQVSSGEDDRKRVEVNSEGSSKQQTSSVSVTGGPKTNIAAQISDDSLNYDDDDDFDEYDNEVAEEKSKSDASFGDMRITDEITKGSDGTIKESIDIRPKRNEQDLRDTEHVDAKVSVKTV